MKNKFAILSCFTFILTIMIYCPIAFAGKPVSPTINATANPESLQAGQSATLSWTTIDADTISIEPGIGTVALNGSITVTPSTTTTYTFSASNSSKTVTTTITVTINPIIELVTLPGTISDRDLPNYTSFGRAFAVDGDYLIVGCPFVKDRKGVNIGVAYIYKRNGQNWEQETKLTSPTNSKGKFGYSVDIRGAYAIIGCTEPPGNVYIFKRESSGWGYKTTINTMYNENIGGAVSITETGNAIIGAPSYILGGSGKAYIYKNVNDNWIENTIVSTTSTGNAEFGTSVSMDGDQAMVGAPNDNLTGETTYGAVYFYHYNGTSWVESGRLASDVNTLGRNVQIRGNRAIASAEDFKSVLVYRYDGQQWIEEAWLHKNVCGFGKSVSINDEMIVVGAPGFYNCSTDGAAYIFQFDGDSWVEQRMIQGTVGFGTAVFTNGKKAFIGDSYGDETAYGGGTIHIYAIPSISIDATPGVINGDASVLTWMSENAETVTIEPNIGSVVTNGSISVNPAQTTVYSITATGPGGTVTDTVAVEVGNVAFSASPNTILRVGESSILTWETTGIDTCTIDQGVGDVPSSGTFTVSPDDTTTYTMTCTGPSGTTSKSTTVNLVPPPFPTVIFDASALVIGPGQSSTLSWTTTNADRVTIDQSIGDVELNGTHDITPSTTTTYRITASNYLKSVYAYITITVVEPPTIGFSAAPMSIGVGETTILTWNAINADNVTIDNGIGEVSPSGSLEQVLNDTTTYIITATGPGGTITKSVTVVVEIPPVVTLAAAPDNIIVGQDVTLTWTTTNADSVSIDQGIGAVSAEGSMIVNPTATTTYIITAVNTFDTVTTDVTVAVANPFTLAITSPGPLANIARPDVMVQGTITNSSGNETGVMVNGITAFVYGNQFVANHVPLEDGENTITAIATDTNGAIYSVSRTVYADLSGEYIRITSNPISGAAPLVSSLDIRGSLAIPSSNVQYTGPGMVTFNISGIDNYEAVIPEQGVYFFTAEVNYNSQLYSDTVAVEVLDELAMEAFLKAKWNNMKSELITGNVEGSVNYFANTTKDRYRDLFNALNTQISQIATNMQDIELVYVKNNTAKFRIVRQQLVGGVSRAITYYIYFIKDQEGIWHVEKF